MGRGRENEKTADERKRDKTPGEGRTATLAAGIDAVLAQRTAACGNNLRLEDPTRNEGRAQVNQLPVLLRPDRPYCCGGRSRKTGSTQTGGGRTARRRVKLRVANPKMGPTPFTQYACITSERSGASTQGPKQSPQGPETTAITLRDKVGRPR